LKAAVCRRSFKNISRAQGAELKTVSLLPEAGNGILFFWPKRKEKHKSKRQNKRMEERSMFLVSSICKAEK
jgi:hypothetical protein